MLCYDMLCNVMLCYVMSGNYSLLGTINVRGQISEHIFAPNGWSQTVLSVLISNSNTCILNACQNCLAFGNQLITPLKYLQTLVPGIKEFGSSSSIRFLLF